MMNIALLLSKIDGLIKEHGSSSILRDHVALLKEQISILEKDNYDFEIKINHLEEQHNIQKNRADNLQKQIEQNARPEYTPKPIKSKSLS